MRRSRVLLVLGIVPLAILAFVAMQTADSTTNAPQQRFPDFGFLPAPPTYTGPYVFRLSQDYPPVKPNDPLPEFFKTDFRKDWRNYMMQVRAYCFEGNLEVNWVVQNNRVRKWYHMPWQHYGPFGREGVHGLTKEAPVQPFQLAATQSSSGQTYAVGFYNPPGGYAIGQVWKNANDPDETWLAKNGFPEGTVVSKLLFVTIPSDEVPSLKANPIKWAAYVTESFESSDRIFQDVTLIQMDIAVRDSRAPLGWVFGTFQYNGQLNHKNPWDNLIPVGLMWGNDPTVTSDEYTNPTPIVTRINPNIKESIINPDPNELPPTHLGWNGRLNGPVDNPKSSCMSCHMTAESPQISAMSPLFTADPPPIGSPAWMRWFRNMKCQESFDEGAYSTDYSLQMSGALQNFRTWQNTKDGLFASAWGDTDQERLLVQDAKEPGGHVEEEQVIRAVNPEHKPKD